MFLLVMVNEELRPFCLDLAPDEKLGRGSVVAYMTDKALSSSVRGLSRVSQCRIKFTRFLPNPMLTMTEPNLFELCWVRHKVCNKNCIPKRSFLKFFKLYFYSIDKFTFYLNCFVEVPLSILFLKVWWDFYKIFSNIKCILIHFEFFSGTLNSLYYCFLFLLNKSKQK